VEAVTDMDVSSIRKDFPIFERTIGGRRLSFLDSGASSQRPRQVIDAMSEYYERHHANVHRSVYQLAAEATDMYEGARTKVARFINSPSTSQVLFSKNVTESLNLVAYTWGRANLASGDKIVLTDTEHHANLVPWFIIAEQTGATIEYVESDDNGVLDLSNIDQKLAGAKVFAFTGVSNVLGTINPVEYLIERARNVGALTVLDFAQWTPHMTTDVQQLGADFVAFTGHKMLGPTGIGVLWGKKEILEAMPPFLGGGDMILDVQLDGFTPNELPWKFEAGTPPIAEAVGLGAAIDYLQQLGMDSIREHEKAITAYALAALKDRIGNKITIYGPTDPAIKSGVLSFTLDGVHPHDVGQVLNEHGVCVRAGHHCAKPLHTKLGVAATTRASFYVYNDTDDVDALVGGLVGAMEFFS
jgi:cysteine desulfurase / selenocysteine lyase